MLTILKTISQILNSVIPVLITLGVVYFIWGIVQYVIAGGEEAKKNGRDRIIYGIIGLAVIVGLWGLVNLVINTFGISGVAPSLAPLTGTAASCSLANNPKFQDILCYITRIINDSVIPLIFALAVASFVWGVVKFFIINADEEAKRAQGKQFMIWGIVALAVMLSVWGLVGILGSTFNIRTNILPQVCPPGSANCASSSSSGSGGNGGGILGGGGSGGGGGGGGVVDCSVCNDDPSLPVCSTDYCSIGGN